MWLSFHWEYGVAKLRRKWKREISRAAARHRLGRISVYFVHFPLLRIHSGIPLLDKNEGLRQVWEGQRAKPCTPQ